MVDKDNKEIKLLGFNFTKVSVEKNLDFKGNLEINQTINLDNIEKFKSDIAKDESLKVSFSYGVNYKELGNVSIKGIMFLMFDTKTTKEILKSWENKKLADNVNMILYNIIIQKSSVKALELEETVGLPYHMSMPVLKSQPESK